MISIITVNYNGLDVLREMLQSVQLYQTQLDVEVIVVDNASEQDPELYLKSDFPEVQFVRSPENLGFAGGNNLGIRMARGDYFFLLNSDAELTPGALERLHNRFRENTNLGIVSPLLVYAPESEQSTPVIQYAGTTMVHPVTARNRTLGEREPDRGQYRHPQPTAYAHGAAMMIPRTVVERVGMMSEAYFLYYEELDWCDHIRRAGYDIEVEPRARVIHKESISVGTDNPLKTYYLNRNRILFMRRNRKRVEQLGFLLFLLSATVPQHGLEFALRGQWQHLRAFGRALTWHLGQKRSTFDTSLPQLRQTTASVQHAVHHLPSPTVPLR